MQTTHHIAHHLSAAIPPTRRGATPTSVPHPFVQGYDWRYEAYHPALAPVLPAVQAFVSDIISGHQPRRWLSLLGPSGIGKTHILKQALTALRQAHARGHWKIPTHTGWRGPQIAHLIPAEDLQDWRAPRDYARHDLIYLEDLAAGSAMEAGAGKVLRSRIAELLQLRSGKWTLLCANLYTSDIATTFDSRIASRLRRDGSTCLELPGSVPDYWG